MLIFIDNFIMQFILLAIALVIAVFFYYSSIVSPNIMVLMEYFIIPNNIQIILIKYKM